jgi:C1A family cysteine protease
MADKQGIPLDTIDGFPEAAVRRLAELWITTAEELVGAAAREDGRRGLAEHLGISQEEVGELVERAQATVPASASFAVEDIERHGLGALDEPEDEEPPEEAPVAFAALPGQVDLREHLPPVRNQGSRGTCVAFACVAVREFLLGDGSAQGDLSEQFLYWDCKRRDLISGPGTFVSTGITCLESDGVCLEQVWPYNPRPIGGNEGQGPPPEDAARKAADYQITDWQKLRSRWVDALREKLADGQPIAFAVPVYTYWFTEPVRSTGDIRLPLPTDKREGGHAMCMVGYHDDPEVPGGGLFLVRNSWGATTWAANSAIEPGHARIPYAYIEQYANAAYVASIEPSDANGCTILRWLRRIWEWLFG